MEEKCIPKDETYLGLKINARSFGERFPNSKEKKSREHFVQSDKKKNEKNMKKPIVTCSLAFFSVWFYSKCIEAELVT